MTQIEPNEAAEHIVLLIDNDQPLYRQKYAMFENLEKKVRNGTYDRVLALKMFKHITDKVRLDFNKKYASEYGGTMTVQASRLADVLLRQDFEGEYLRYEKHITIKNTALTGKY